MSDTERHPMKRISFRISDELMEIVTRATGKGGEFAGDNTSDFVRKLIQRYGDSPYLTLEIHQKVLEIHQKIMEVHQ